MLFALGLKAPNALAGDELNPKTAVKSCLEEYVFKVDLKVVKLEASWEE